MPEAGAQEKWRHSTPVLRQQRLPASAHLLTTRASSWSSRPPSVTVKLTSVHSACTSGGKCGLRRGAREGGEGARRVTQ